MAETGSLFIALYTDEDVTSELAPAVRARGFQAKSAAEAGMLNVDDKTQLSYATSHQMAIVTYNARDFLILARQYAEAGLPHAGIMISSEQFSRRGFGELLRLVLHVLNTISTEEIQNRVLYLRQVR